MTNERDNILAEMWNRTIAVELGGEEYNAVLWRDVEQILTAQEGECTCKIVGTADIHCVVHATQVPETDKQIAKKEIGDAIEAYHLDTGYTMELPDLGWVIDWLDREDE